MINFFRKLRLSSLRLKPVSKYLLYATGEIILVVIGILIALQINNWNEFRKERKREKMYLEALQKDLQESQSELKRVIDKKDLVTSASLKLIEYQQGYSNACSPGI